MARVIESLGYALLQDGEPVKVGPWVQRRAGIYPTESKARAALAQFTNKSWARGRFEIVEVVPGATIEAVQVDN